MYISKVSLVNYRNFANASFKFEKGINTIIGENGSGKTNAFRAIRLLLEDASLQYAYKLTEGDFNRDLGKDNWKGHWIIISIEFDEINNEEDESDSKLKNILPVTKPKDRNNYMITISGPGIQFQKEVNSEDDFLIVNAIIDNIKKHINQKNEEE